MAQANSRVPTILIKNGRVIDPASGRNGMADVLLEGGKVAAIGSLQAGRTDRVIDAVGLIVSPGLIDMHVHLREPGNEDEETIASGTEAAVAGGFASIVCMPNTEPPLDNEAAIEFVSRQAGRAGRCNVFPLGAITKGRRGEELAEMGQMVRAGAVGFSDDGCGVASAAVMLKALQYVKMFDRPILQHCQEPTLSAGEMNAGYTAMVLGLSGIPAIAEDLMVQRDLVLVEATGARYHVLHVSSRGAVELIRAAKARGVRVTAEVCPHHLLLTEEACRTYDPNFKMNPPLRARSDVKACLEAVGDSTIDCLASDHAPHKDEEKQLEFAAAPFGIVGLETMLGLVAKALIEPGLLDWAGLIARMTVNPARVLGLGKGTLAIGADADVTLIDSKRRWRVDRGAFRSQSANCPFDGWELTGKAVCTIVGGAIKYYDDDAKILR